MKKNGILNILRIISQIEKEILKIPLAEGGNVEKNLTKRTVIDDIILSSAMNKISDAMSGVSGLLARSRLNSGGSIKAKIKQPKQIKRINLADYFKAGVNVAELSSAERAQVNSLLSKMLKSVARCVTDTLLGSTL